MYCLMCFSGTRPKGEVQVSSNVHPGAKDGVQRPTAAAYLSGVFESLTQ